MYINICIFEDNLHESLQPLTFFRPIYDCYCGCNRILDKLIEPFENVNVTLHMRNHLKPLFQKEYGKRPINKWNKGAPCLFINGRLLYSESFIQHLLALDPSQNNLITYKGQVLAAGLMVDQLDTMHKLLDSPPDNASLIQAFRTISVTKEWSDAALITNPWDIISFNSDAIKLDAKRSKRCGVNKADMRPFSSIYNEEHVYIGERTQIEDFVVLDATKGPIYIEPDVYIQSHSRLEGPLYIGHHTHILRGSIKQSTIAPHCKVGGEISQTIMMPFSNKAHHGYLGNSFVGSWVNLGAGTTTSNLKSNYGTVKIQRNEDRIDTDLTFLGALIGDYVKTGIGTLLNAGTMLGPGSSIFGGGIHPKWIPPFQWGSASGYDPIDPEKFLATTQKMMKRRNQEMSQPFVTIIRELFSN